jgi:hypothetical protein
VGEKGIQVDCRSDLDLEVGWLLELPLLLSKAFANTIPFSSSLFNIFSQLSSLYSHFSLKLRNRS